MNIIDIILISLILLVVLTSARKGFVRSLIEFVSGLLSVAIAYAISPVISTEIYNRFFQEKVIAHIGESLPEVLSETTGSIDYSQAIQALPEGIRGIAEYFASSSAGFFDISSIAQAITPQEIERAVAAPVVTTLIRIIAFIVIVISLLIIFKILARVITKLVRFTFLRSFNTLLGGVFGGIKGIIYVVVLVFAFTLIASLAAPSSFSDAVASSKVIELVDNLKMLL